jgi:hypothetical protein
MSMYISHEWYGSTQTTSTFGSEQSLLNASRTFGAHVSAWSRNELLKPIDIRHPRRVRSRNMAVAGRYEEVATCSR